MQMALRWLHLTKECEKNGLIIKSKKTQDASYEVKLKNTRITEIKMADFFSSQQKMWHSSLKVQCNSKRDESTDI